MSTDAARPCSERWRRQIDRAFVAPAGGQPEAASARALLAHVADCGGCRLYYDRLGAISAALQPDAALAGSALDRICAVVLAEASGPAAARPGRARPESSWWSRTTLWMGASMAVTAMAAVVIVSALRKPSSGSGGRFKARGGDITAERVPGVTALCVGSEPAPGPHMAPPQPPGAASPLLVTLASVDRVVAAVSGLRASLPVGSMRCKVGDSLQLTYSTPQGRELYMLARGETETGIVRWYAPTSADGALPVLAANTVDGVLPWSTRLAVRHEPGLVKMTVRFFDRPMTGAEAAAVVGDGAELQLQLELVP